MSDSVSWEAAAEVWRAINGDPDLLMGVTLGQFDALAEAMSLLILRPDVRATFPLALVKEFSSVDISKAEETFDLVQRVFSVPIIRSVMDQLAGITR